MTKEPQSKSSDVRHLLVVGLPLGFVLGVLILGAALQSGPTAAAPSSPIAAADPPLPPPPSYERRRQAVPDEAAEPRPEVRREEVPTRRTEPARASRKPTDAVTRLGRRAMADAGRLESTGDAWTSQVGVYCDSDHVSKLVAQFEGLTDLYVLPVLLDDRPCFRVCWGHYADHARAKEAPGLPAALGGGSSFPQRISVVVQ